MTKTVVRCLKFDERLTVQVGAIASFRSNKQTKVGVVTKIGTEYKELETKAKYTNVNLLLDKQKSYRKAEVTTMDGKEIVYSRDLTVLTPMARAKVFMSADDVDGIVESLGIYHPTTQSVLAQIERPLPDNTMELEVQKALDFLEYMKTVEPTLKAGTKPSRLFE